LHYNSLFPFESPHQRRIGFKVLLGIGGNVGDTKRRFIHLFQSLSKISNFKILATSPILKNPPFGYLQQNYFYNAVILLETTLFPNQFLNRILYLEKQFGRKRTFKNAPRTLDIDIIFFDNFKLKTEKLIVPHKDWQNRSSVLIPLINLGR
jgi:2-amino-4-hydroxy-6-hydroxymethyldihydropteridine diphosphokinase